MNANEIVAAGVTHGDRTWVVLSDGSRWEWIPEEARGWERVHRGMPGLAWTPTETSKVAPKWAAAAFGPEVAR